MIRALPVGEHALLLEVDSAPEVADLHAHVEALRDAGGLDGVVDVVPGARTLLLDGLADPARTAEGARHWRVAPARRDPAGEVTLEVVYDGEDLGAVAGCWGCEPGEVGRIHADLVFTVAFCGFAPGFAYMTGLPDELSVPRRATPRARVPAGSVALAGAYTGVYPSSSPGGWQLIGRTAANLWDAERDPAAMLTPGTRVRLRTP